MNKAIKSYLILRYAAGGLPGGPPEGPGGGIGLAGGAGLTETFWNKDNLGVTPHNFGEEQQVGSKKGEYIVECTLQDLPRTRSTTAKTRSQKKY